MIPTEETKRKISESIRKKWDEDPDYRHRSLSARNKFHDIKVQQGYAICTRCGVPKQLKEFPKGRKRRDGSPRYAYCKLCHSEYQREQVLKNQFNLTPGEYETLARFQFQECAVCGKKPKTKRLSVDHNHRTGLIRGLLCSFCNRTIGLFQDDITKFERVVAYLTRPPATLAFGTERYGAKGKTNTRSTPVTELGKRRGGLILSNIG